MAQILGLLTVVLTASVLAVWLFGRVALPSIVAYIAAGIAVGPHGLGLVRDRGLIDSMAEVGVVLLMFTIGLKFSFAELARMRAMVLGGGAVQVGLTVAACVVASVAAGLSASEGVFVGFLVAMSSTAIILKLLEVRAESDAPHGRLAVGVSIFQDLCVVPMILLLPLLAGKGGSPADAMIGLGKSLAAVVAIVVVARFVLPRYFGFVARTRSREAFTLATVLVILATAGATATSGLSLALGALVAGVVLSESEYASQVLSDVVPLRDLLASLFFVSVGMLVDVGAWFSDPLSTFGLAAAAIALKAAVVFPIGLAFGMGWRISLLAAIALGQVGEFSFVLASEARPLGLLGDAVRERVISVSVLTMVAVPLLYVLALRIVPRSAVAASPAGGARGRAGHVIVVGYGVTGRNVVSVLRPLGVPVVVLELNPRTVRAVRAAGGDAEYGDATSEAVLDELGVREARALVLTALDPAATRQIVAGARRRNPTLDICVRTRFVGELAELHRLGATSVIAEELETSIALAGHVMRRFGAGDQAVARASAALRGDDYALLTAPERDAERSAALSRLLAADQFQEVDVPTGASPGSIGALGIRTRTGCTVVGVERAGELVPNPSADFVLAGGDRLVVLGPAGSARKLGDLLGVPAV